MTMPDPASSPKYWRLSAPFSLRWKMLLSFGLLAACTMTLVCLVWLFGLPFTGKSGWYGHDRSEVLKELSLVADLKRERFLLWLDERKRDADVLAQDPTMQSAVRQLESVARPDSELARTAEGIRPALQRQPAYDELMRHLMLTRRIYPGYEKIQVADAQTGVILASTREAEVGGIVSPKWYVTNALINGYGTWVGVQKGALDGKNYLVISRAVRDERSVEDLQDATPAVLLLYIDTVDFVRPMLHMGGGLGESGEVVLVDEKARLLAPLKHPLPGGGAAKVLEYRLTRIPAILASQGKEGIAIEKDYRDVPVVAAYRHMRVTLDAGWGMVVKRDVDEVFGPLRQGVFYSFILTLLSIAAAGIVGALIAGRISRPIETLSKAAQEVETGNLDVRVPVTGSDEVGILAGTFNSMLGRMQHWHQDLEEQVRARTVELEESISSLGKSEARYRALLDNMPVGVAMYGATDNGEDFTILDFNRGAERIEGVKGADIVGKSVAAVFPGVKEFGLFEVFQRVWRTGKPEHFPVSLYRDGRIEGWRENSVYKLPSGEVVTVYTDETERKRAELALRASEEKYRVLVNNAPIGILSADETGRILEVNRKLVEIMGSPGADSTKAFNILSFKPLVDAGISAVFRRCLEEAKPQTAEIPYTSAWGTIAYLRILLTPFLDGEGEVKGCQAVIEDVSDRKLARLKLEWELAVNSALAELYVPLSSQSSSVEDIADLVLDKAKTLTGSEHGYVSEIDPQSGDNVGHTLTRMMEYGCEVSAEGKIAFPKGPDGGYPKLLGHSLNTKKAFFTNSPQSHPASGGVPEGHIPINRFLSVPVIIGEELVGQVSLANPDRDYTPEDLGAVERLAGYYALALQRKRWEQELRESQQTLELALTGADLGLWDFDVKAGRGRIPEHSARLIGYSLDEIEPTLSFWENLIHPDDRQRALEVFSSHLDGRAPYYEDEYRIRAQSGEWKWVLSRGKVVERDDEGNPLRMAGTYLDITARKHSELALRRLATAVEQAAEAIIITDPKGEIEYVNPAFERITGYTREEAVVQRACWLRADDDDARIPKGLHERLNRGETWAGRFAEKRKDGTSYEADATISPVRDSSGKITNLVAVKRDITQEVQLQKQLFQAQKMEAIGTLAGGIAHDFNNLLQVVLGYSELILMDERLDFRLKDDLHRVHGAALNGADLVRRLLTFSRKTETSLRPLNLNHRIDELKRLLARTVPKMIEIEVILASDLAPVNADPTQIEQVLMNLALNAKDAMPDGGRLVIETENVFLDSDYCKAHLDAEPGHYVLLEVTDSGHGMDRVTIEHIFEPFFTTKAPGEGTGLGLAMVYAIVKQHGGYLMCYSEPDQGTTFKIYFPALVSESRSDEPMVKSLPAGGSETILLVDDEELVRDLGERILRKAGYAVLTAANGEEGLSAYRAHQDSVGLVILDLIMPVMGGQQCLEELLKIDPGVKVLIATGYSAEGPKKDAFAGTAIDFVSKPYDMRQLLRSVREALDSVKMEGG